MLSIVTTGRDDNYGRHFVHSMKLSLNNTIKILEQEKLTYEVIVVDWSPLDKKLEDNLELQEIKNNNNVKFYVVEPAKVEKKGLNPKNFYEYFAKNVGVKQTKYEWILIHNPDILLSKEIVTNIHDVMRNKNVMDKQFYRFNKRIATDVKNAEFGNWRSLPAKELRNSKNPDDHVLGAFGGDVLFLSKYVFCELGKGYNEGDIQHKHKDFRQSSMDSEILLNMHKNGARMSIIQEPYCHINHEYPAKRSGRCNFDGYENVSDWGNW